MTKPLWKDVVVHRVVVVVVDVITKPGNYALVSIYKWINFPVREHFFSRGPATTTLTLRTQTPVF